MRIPLTILKRALTHGRLRDLLDYNPETGDFIWRVDNGRAHKGEIAGCVDRKAGVRVIGVDGRYYTAHRLAYFWMKGEWPPQNIDHKDCNSLNNRWDNLRPCTQQQNLCNRRVPRNNRYGIKGVWHDPGKRGYIGGIGTRWLGVYETPEEAHEAYLREARRLYGEFAREA